MRTESMLDAAAHHDAHAWAAPVSEASIQAILLSAGVPPAVADEVGAEVADAVRAASWAQAAAALAEIVGQLTGKDAAGVAVARALGLLPGALRECALRAGVTKQAVEYHDQRLRAALGRMATVRADTRRFRDAAGGALRRGANGHETPAPPSPAPPRAKTKRRPRRLPLNLYAAALRTLTAKAGPR